MTINGKTLQVQSASGRWNGASDFGQNQETRLAAAATYNAMSAEQVEAALTAGKSLRYGTDWYENIRMEPAPVTIPVVSLVACHCGHSVPRAQVMSASLGTSCPRCYDRMSGE